MRGWKGIVNKKIAHSRKQTKKKPFQGLDNTSEVDIVLQKTKLMQDVFGLTTEDISKMFDVAISFMQQHRFDEAIHAFTFLTKVNPYISDFWMGLGAAYQSQGSFKEALSAFIAAETMDPIRIEPYGFAVEVCLEMGDVAQALTILKQGYMYFKKHSKETEAKHLLTGLKSIQRRIMLEKAS